MHAKNTKPRDMRLCGKTRQPKNAK